MYIKIGPKMKDSLSANQNKWPIQMENKENSSHCHQEVVLSTLRYPNDYRWNQLITIYNLSDYFTNRGKLITIGHILTCG